MTDTPTFNKGRDTLADARVLIALLLNTDNGQNRVLSAVQTLPSGGLLLAVWPVVTEAAHFLGKAGGWPAQSRLYEMLTAGPLRVFTPKDAEQNTKRIFELMEQYQNLPCDLADAALVACGETTGLRRVLTPYGHFFAYRTAGGDAFVVLPGPAS